MSLSLAAGVSGCFGDSTETAVYRANVEPASQRQANFQAYAIAYKIEAESRGVAVDLSEIAYRRMKETRVETNGDGGAAIEVAECREGAVEVKDSLLDTDASTALEPFFFSEFSECVFFATNKTERYGLVMSEVYDDKILADYVDGRSFYLDQLFEGID